MTGKMFLTCIGYAVLMVLGFFCIPMGILYLLARYA